MKKALLVSLLVILRWLPAAVAQRRHRRVSGRSALLAVALVSARKADRSNFRERKATKKAILLGLVAMTLAQ
jgi:hypothetical protein